MASSDAIQSLALTIDALATTNRDGFEFIGRNQLNTNKSLDTTNKFMMEMATSLAGMQDAAFEQARKSFKEIEMPQMPGAELAQDGGDQKPKDKSKTGMLKGLGSLFSGAGIGGGVAMAGLGALFAGGGYLIKQLNDLDGEKIAKEIEALTNMNVGVIDVVKLTMSLGAIGAGLAVLGFGKLVYTGAGALDAAVTGDAFQSFTGSDKPASGFAETLKKDIETLLGIGANIKANDMLSGFKFAITMSMLGFGLAAFGAGKVVEGGATALTGVMHEGVKRFTDKENTGMGERVKTEVETLLSIKGGVLDAAAVALSLTVLGVGLAFFGIGKVADGAGAVAAGASNEALNRFTDKSSEGWATRTKDEVEELLSIKAPTIDAVKVAFALSVLGVGLAFFGIGKVSDGAGTLATGASDAALERFTGEESEGWATRVKKEVEVLLGIAAPAGDAVKVAFALGVLGLGLAFFGIGKVVNGVGSAVEGVSSDAVDKFTGTANAGMGARVKKEVEDLLSIGGITFSGVAGVVGALGALGVGLALFGMGKAVAGVGSAVGDAAMETGALLTDNPIYKEAGFGAKIKKEVETLLSIGGTTNEALTEGGTFLVMMTAVAAGLAVFGVASGAAGLGMGLARLTGGEGDKSFAQTVKSEVDTLLTIGADADITKANNLHAVLLRIGSALSSFAGDNFGASLKNLGSSILNFFSGDEGVTAKMLKLADKADSLGSAAVAMEQLGTSLKTIGSIDMGSGEKLKLENMTEDLLDSLPDLEGALYGGAHAKKLGLGIDNVTDSKYYEHGIGLANIDPLVMAQGAQNLNMMIKAVSGTLGESDLFDVGKAMKQSSATDIMPNLKNAVAAKTANDQAVAGSGGGDISNVNAQDMSTNTTIMPGGGGGGGEPGTAHVPQNSGRASETDNPFVMF
jgi:hypothetical protein